MINLIKKIIGKVSLRIINNNNFTVFLFHEISDDPSSFQKKYKLYHSVEEFTYLINWINKNYEILSPIELDKIKEIHHTRLKKKMNFALISFDDGYEGSFNNGIPILLKYNLASIHFLNMFPIVYNRPNLVSLIDYLLATSQKFRKFLNSNNIKDKVIYRMTPNLLKEFMHNEKNEINFNEILSYQGKNISLEHLEKYKDNRLIFYGNHFFDHWNTLILNKDEVREQYLTNEKYLKNFNNYINYFAFTHGSPNSNFNIENLNYILSLNPLKIFCVTGGTNSNKNLNNNRKIIDRTFVNKNELENGMFGYRLLRSNILKKQYKNYFN